MRCSDSLPDMTFRYTLHYAPDNASGIIRFVLEEMGLPYDAVLVDRQTGAQNTAEYLALNPSGKIPVLVTPVGPMSEVGAILLYLSETHATMMPDIGADDRPAFLKWLFWMSNTLHPDLIMQFYLHRYGDDAAQASMRDRVVARIQNHFSILDRMVAVDQPKWLGAATPTGLDFYVAMCLRWSALYPKDHSGWLRLNAYPELHRIVAVLENCATVRKVADIEGLGPTPFTAPQYVNPPEGVAL